MAIYTYKAKKGPTEIVEGSLEAESDNAALTKLSHLGYFPIAIHREGGVKGRAFSGFAIFRKIRVHDLSIFTRQLSDLLDSGLTLLNALNVTYRQTENKALQAVIGDIREQVRDGRQFSAALSKYPDIFSDLYVSMARSGETGGMLEDILARLAAFSEAQEGLQSKVKSALAYPAVMASVGLLTIVVLITFVIPKIVTMFEDLGQVLPLPTAILVSISRLFVNYWYIIIGVIALFLFILARIIRTKEGRLAIDQIKLSTPIIGDLIKKSEISRFSRTLGTLLQNGVPILESLDVVSSTMQNAVLRDEIVRTYLEVRDGKSLSKSLFTKKHFPGFAVNMLAVGEEGGNLEKSLFKVADSYERETDNVVKVMTSLLEPFLILTMGLVVGFIVVSMLLPIFEINVIAY
ncbi:MAG: type II secretion system F family protein [Candidatus Omnitrophica bacterium]|nr:type II secretion system F family protein [Candidatus Omnitrophota bacterium]